MLTCLKAVMSKWNLTTHEEWLVFTDYLEEIGESEWSSLTKIIMEGCQASTRVHQWFGYLHDYMSSGDRYTNYENDLKWWKEYKRSNRI